MLKPKPKFKYCLLGEPVPSGSYAFPEKQYMTIDIRDTDTKIFYMGWRLNQAINDFRGDTKACYVLIGIRRA
jgi:hypothetical protein